MTKLHYDRREYYQNTIEVIFPLEELNEDGVWYPEDYGWDYCILRSYSSKAIEWAKSLGCTVDGNENPVIKLGDNHWYIGIDDRAGNISVYADCQDFVYVSEDADHYDTEVIIEYDNLT